MNRSIFCCVNLPGLCAFVATGKSRIESRNADWVLQKLIVMELKDLIAKNTGASQKATALYFEVIEN